MYIVLIATDGSGWTKVRSGGQTGLVPNSYIELEPEPQPMLSPPPVNLSTRPSSTYSSSSSILSSAAAAKKKGPAVAPKRGAKKVRYVEAMYEYTAQSDVEFSMAEGERFVLVKEDGGDGWAEVEKNGVVKSVPANYVQACE